MMYKIVILLAVTTISANAQRVNEASTFNTMTSSNPTPILTSAILASTRFNFASTDEVDALLILFDAALRPFMVQDSNDFGSPVFMSDLCPVNTYYNQYLKTCMSSPDVAPEGDDVE